MHSTISRNNIGYDYISYVPSSKNALKKRGYNQAEYIAKLLAEKTDKKLLHCIGKYKETKDQIGLSGSNRWSNLKESFSFIGENNIESSSILLIDDVITTGATAFYCSELLLKHGCGKVIILTVAKSKI
jgi:competence protein ComFC